MKLCQNNATALISLRNNTALVFITCLDAQRFGKFEIFKVNLLEMNNMCFSHFCKITADLYHTLFESHLSYCISVWGGASSYITTKIWTAQKHCLRVLFGDKQAYLDKFKTCAKTRPFPHQTLDSDFFQLEHTKPLFKKYEILAMENLYTYHTFMEAFKILKLRCPISLHGHFNISARKETTLISTFGTTNDFISRSTSIWNTIAPKFRLQDYSYKIGLAKSNLKKALLRLQHLEDQIEWTPNDFNFGKITSEMLGSHPQSHS